MSTIRIVVGLALGLLFVRAALAQVNEFAVVEATVTSDGVRYLFNDSLDARASAEALLRGFVVFSPRDSIRVDSIYVGDDPRRLEVEASFTPNTDFVFVLSGIRSASLRALYYPHVLSFTTAPEAGPHTVGGRIEVPLTKNQAGDPSPFVVALARTRPDTEADTLHLDLAFAHPLTFQQFAWAEPYTIEGVRDGTYWPVFFADHDADGFLTPKTRIDDFAPYNVEFDLDAPPDSIVVAGRSHSGIDFVPYKSVVNPPAELPGVGILLPSYPNPFREATALAFLLDRPARLRLAVYDLRGRHVATIAEGFFLSGPHEALWRPARLPSGVYAARLEGDGFTLVRPLLLVR